MTRTLLALPLALALSGCLAFEGGYDYSMRIAKWRGEIDAYCQQAAAADCQRANQAYINELQATASGGAGYSPYGLLPEQRVYVLPPPVFSAAPPPYQWQQQAPLPYAR